MITFPRVRAAIYTTAKRMQGWHLLKNPAGTSRAEVTMIKVKRPFSTMGGDNVFETTRVTRTFHKKGSDERVINLYSTHYMDQDTMEMTKPRKKLIELTVRDNGKETLYTSKDDMPDNHNLVARLPEEVRKRKEEEPWRRDYCKTHYPRWYKNMTLGLYEKLGEGVIKRDKPNFFKVLYQNLTNK